MRTKEGAQFTSTVLEERLLHRGVLQAEDRVDPKRVILSAKRSYAIKIVLFE